LSFYFLFYFIFSFKFQPVCKYYVNEWVGFNYTISDDDDFILLRVESILYTLGHFAAITNSDVNHQVVSNLGEVVHRAIWRNLGDPRKMYM